MTKQRVKRPAARAIRPPRPPTPTLRAWHIVMANGGDATVTAHSCESSSGVLEFFNREVAPDDYFGPGLLVRAFAPAAWQDVELVDVPTVPSDASPPAE